MHLSNAAGEYFTFVMTWIPCFGFLLLNIFGMERGTSASFEFQTVPVCTISRVCMLQACNQTVGYKTLQYVIIGSDEICVTLPR